MVCRRASSFMILLMSTNRRGNETKARICGGGVTKKTVDNYRVTCYLLLMDTNFYLPPQKFELLCR